MTLALFENELRKESQQMYSNLKDGRRKEKLKDKPINSLTDVFYLGRNNSRKLWQGCVITFGKLLEKTLINYAEKQGAKVYRNTKFGSIEIDGIFLLMNNLYNLESKANIELDKEKTYEALKALKRKHTAVYNGFECENKHWNVISRILVWTKETSDDAARTAKKPLEQKHLMGFKEFFELFNINVTKEDFFKMLQRVWMDEVEVYF